MSTRAIPLFYPGQIVTYADGSRLYRVTPATPAWPEVDVDLDRPSRIPFGFQRPTRRRTSTRPPSRQARAARKREIR